MRSMNALYAGAGRRRNSVPRYNTLTLRAMRRCGMIVPDTQHPKVLLLLDSPGSSPNRRACGDQGTQNEGFSVRALKFFF